MSAARCTEQIQTLDDIRAFLGGNVEKDCESEWSAACGRAKAPKERGHGIVPPSQDNREEVYCL